MPFKDPEAQRAYKRQYYQKHKERKRTLAKQWNDDNAERKKATARRWYENNKEISLERSRKTNLRRKYGLTPEEVEQKLKSQNNQCGICHITFDTTSKATSPHVDHDHTTGKVRSLLCDFCNKALGFFRDDPNLCVKAASYLEFWK